MVVDIVFPGWMPWRRFAVAHDVPDVIAQVEEIRKMDWETLVGGRVARTGSHADVEVQAEFYRDLKHAAAAALAGPKPGVGMDPKDQTNPWAVFDNYLDRVAAQCVNTVTRSGQPGSRRSMCTFETSVTPWNRACGSTRDSRNGAAERAASSTNVGDHQLMRRQYHANHYHHRWHRDLL